MLTINQLHSSHPKINMDVKPAQDYLNNFF